MSAAAEEMNNEIMMIEKMMSSKFQPGDAVEVNKDINMGNGRVLNTWAAGEVENVSADGKRLNHGFDYTIEMNFADGTSWTEYNVKEGDLRHPGDDMDERVSIFTGKTEIAYRTKFAEGTVKKDYYARKDYMLFDQEGKGSCVWIPVHRVKKDCRKLIRKAQKKFSKECNADKKDKDYIP